MTVYQTAHDLASQQEVAQIVGKAKCWDFHAYGEMSPIDWFITQGGKLVGLAELKCRTHPSTQYPTVYLSARKWISLYLGSFGMGVPAYFVVRFTDTICYINLEFVDPRQPVMLGRTRDYRTKNDIEPMIQVPVNRMTVVHRFEPVAASADCEIPF